MFFVLHVTDTLRGIASTLIWPSLLHSLRYTEQLIVWSVGLGGGISPASYPRKYAQLRSDMYRFMDYHSTHLSTHPQHELPRSSTRTHPKPSCRYSPSPHQIKSTIPNQPTPILHSRTQTNTLLANLPYRQCPVHTRQASVIN
jgi:hypothetical protein